MDDILIATNVERKIMNEKLPSNNRVCEFER
jgi:hypothetical protein